MKVKKRYILISILFITVSFFTLLILDKALSIRDQRNLLIEQANSIPKLVSTTSFVQPKRTTLIVIGDSIIANYPLHIFLGHHFYTVNAGIGGNSIVEVGQRLKQLHLKKNETLIIEGGINDIIGCVIKNGDRQKLLEKIQTQYAEIVANYSLKCGKLVLCTITPTTDRFFFPYMEILPYGNFFETDKVNQLVVEANLIIRSIALENEIQLIDLHRATSNRCNLIRRYASPDGYHINQFGYEAISREIIIQLLKN